MKTEPPDEPLDEPPADEPAASEPDEDTVDINRIHTAAMIHAVEKIETILAHARNSVRQARWNIQTTDSLLAYLKASGATLSNIKANLLGNDDD